MPPNIPKNILAKIPATPAGQANLTELYRRLKTLLDRSSRGVSPLSILKYAACVILFLNAGSLPLVWHIRVFWPIFLANVKLSAFRLRLALAPKRERARALVAWSGKLSHVGADPFEISTAYRRWATIDDIDALMHLSNSSYAKALDSARVKMIVDWFFSWGYHGGQVALGATHYHFIREIRPFVRYEVRLTIGAWDHKWLYIVSRFVTPPTHRPPTSPSLQTSTPSTPNDARAQNGYAAVDQLAAAIIQDTNGTGSTIRTPIVEPDGAILHCVAVSQICFKLGRITVPPAIVLATQGFTKPPDGGVAYSHANPPPHWIKTQALQSPPHGSIGHFRAFLEGKWRDLPEGERWWEDALGGSVETKRQANLEILGSLKLGLEQIRTLR